MRASLTVNENRNTEVNLQCRKAALSGRFRYLFYHGIVWILLSVTVPRMGEQAFVNWSGPALSLSNDLYIPAVMLAAGCGFRNAPAHDQPEFSDFLLFNRRALDHAVVCGLPSLPLSDHQSYHVYLLWTVGAWWRVWGISWNAFKELSLGFLILTAWMIYGCMTVFLPWWLALPLTLMSITSPAVLFTVQYLRDFAKAPFILAGLWAALLFLKKERRGREVMQFAAAAGVLTGIGLGFRRDLIIMPPVFLGILIFTPLATEMPRLSRWKYRITGSLILILLTGSAGWPIWRAFHTYGSLTDHDTLMGFATNGDVEMDILPGSYEKIPILNDLYISACVTAHAHLNAQATSAESEIPLTVPPYPDGTARRKLIRYYLARFPWDTLVVRWTAAAWTLASGGPTSAAPGLSWIQRAGPFLAAAVTALLLVSYGFRGMLMSLLLYVFPGYTALQFAARHVFQFSFLPWLSAGICFLYCLHGIQSIYGCRRAGETCPDLNAVRPNKPLILTLAGGGVLLIGAVILLHTWQRHNLENAAKRIQEARGPEIPHITDTWDNAPLFIPEKGDWRPGQATAFGGTVPDMLMMTCRVAMFDRGVPPWAVRLIYEDTRGWDGFSAPVRLYLPDWDKTPWFLYFPVFTLRQGAELIYFVGVSVEAPFDAKFLGFRSIDPHRLPPESAGLVMGIPETGFPGGFLATQGIRTIYSGERTHPGWIMHNPRMDVHRDLQQAAALITESRFSEARGIIDSWLQLRPASLTWHLAAARAMLKEGKTDAALSQVENYLLRYGGGDKTYLLEPYLRERLRPESGADTAGPGQSASVPDEPGSGALPGGKNKDHTARSRLKVGTLSGSRR